MCQFTGCTAVIMGQNPAISAAVPTVPPVLVNMIPTSVMVSPALAKLQEIWALKYYVFFINDLPYNRHHLFLKREGRSGTTDDFTTSFLHFPCSPLPSGTWRTPGLSIPSCCFPPLSLSAVSSPPPPFTVPCKIVLVRPDEQDTCPYHCSLRLFTMVRRSSCGPIACWILARTSSLVTWSLYEMCSILR